MSPTKFWTAPGFGMVAGLMLFVCPADGAGQQAATVDDFSWLEGRWVGPLDVGDGLARAEVQYFAPQGGVIAGSFQLTRGPSTLVLELFSLVDVDGRVEMRVRHFDAELNAWERDGPIVLQLDSVSGSRFIFRNPTHDRPRWSTLERLGPTRFRAHSEIFDSAGGRSEIDIVYDKQGSDEPPELATALLPFQALLGTWEAVGDGFRTVLSYRRGPTGRIIYADNVVLGKDGYVLARYEGWYVVDSADEHVRFETHGASGEVHSGRVDVSGSEIWHDAQVVNGSVEGYRSHVRVDGAGRMEYRALYRPDAERSAVRSATPLVYQRRSGS